MRQLLGAILIVSLLGPCVRAQATLLVPSQFPTVQSAITAAQNGDTVLVDPGTYVESITPNGKAITIRSSQGAEVTTIDAGFAGPGLAVIAGESPQTVIEGFRFTNGVGFPVAFINNVPIRAGGGVYVSNSSPVIRDCIIEGNHATRGGGIECSGSVFVQRCVIRSNIALRKGGGATILPGGLPVMENCLITGNSAGFAGGGIAAEGTTMALVVGCLIADNVLPGPATVASLKPGGGVFLHSAAAITLSSCTIARNVANVGGGIGCDGDISAVVVRNSLLWYNSGAAIAGVLGSPLVEYSSIQGGFPGTGNIASAPLFADFQAGDYHILPGSPAINAGTTATLFLPATDIDGEPRVIWGNPDMGCDELADISAAPAAAGNVGLSAGAPERVLLVNGSDGGGDRRVHQNVGEFNSISLLQPSLAQNPVDFAIFGYLAEPTAADIVTLPLGIGDMAFTPHVLIPWAYPQVFTFTHSAGAIAGAAVGSTPTPWTSSAQAGAPFPLTVSFQAVVEESPGQLRASNCVILIIE